MPFAPQPYPLFAAFHENDKPTVARIIGWHSPADDDSDSSHIQPVALHHLRDGDVSEPKYLDLEHESHWLGQTPDDALTQLRYADEKP
jgi:hypothetical protein